MPPRRRRQIPLIIPPSLSDSQPTIHQVHMPRQTRSGKTFGAPSSTTARRRHPRHLTPGSPPRSHPRAVQKRKSRTIVEDSDSDESNDDQTYGPSIKRPRRGSALTELAVVGSQPNQQNSADTDIEGIRSPPATVDFPWGFCIPLPELNQTDRHMLLFAQVSEDDLRTVLRQIGCSVVGKTRPQLVKLCIHYAQLIHRLGSSQSHVDSNTTPPPPLPNASKAPGATPSNPTNIPSNGAPHSPLNNNSNHTASCLSRPPLHQSPQAPQATVSNSTDKPSNGAAHIQSINESNNSPARPSQRPSLNAAPAHRISNTTDILSNGTDSSQLNADSNNSCASSSQPPIEDLIQWHTPPNPRHQRMNTGSSGPSSSPLICFTGHETAIPSSVPDLTQDLPRNPNGANEDVRSPALHTMQDSQTAIINLLRTHSEKISVIQDDISLTLRHQQEIRDKLESISDILLHPRQRAGRPPRPNPTRNNVPARQPIPRTGRLKQLQKLHFESLFGRPAGADLPPSPATTSEKAMWRSDTNDDDNPEDGEMGCISDNPESNDEASDPQFPYRGGPGHPWASQEQLKIMHRMLKAKGMKRFRMDLGLSLTAPENVFCLTVARDIFVQLVECGEYDGLQPDECAPDYILQQLTEYVREKFVRRVREKAKFPPEVQLLRAKEKSRSSRKVFVRNSRVQSALEIGSLQALIPIIQGCTSDDETDDEITPAPLASSASSPRNPAMKFCKTRHVVWRSKEVTQAFIMLDEYREKRISSTCKARRGVPARSRRRPPCPTLSTMKPATALTEEAYDKDWLETQPRVIVDSLHIVPQPVMQKMLRRLKSLT